MRVENTSETDPLVILKHFGPGNPDAEPLQAATELRQAATSEVEIDDRCVHTSFPALHNAMWPGLVGKGARTPSRRSTSTRCSI